MMQRKIEVSQFPGKSARINFSQADGVGGGQGVSGPPPIFRQGFHQRFQQEGHWFSQMSKTNRAELLCKKNFPLGQTSWAKLSSHPVKLPGARP